MKWRFFSSWSKKSKQLPAAVRNFDRKLIKSVRHRIVPSFTQFKYISRFLTKTEKRLIKAALLLIALSLISAGIIFLIMHIGFEPKSGGEYSEALIGQPKLINPLFSGTNDVDADLCALIYSGLFSYNKDEQIVPELADSFTIGDDKKTYLVTLKKNLFWSDGEPLTADDVVFTFESIQNAEVGSPLFTAFQGVKIEKVDQKLKTRIDRAGVSAYDNSKMAYILLYYAAFLILAVVLGIALLLLL